MAIDSLSDITRSGVSAFAPGPSGATGRVLIDFGAFPGSSDTQLVINGQAAIVAGSVVNAWLTPSATVDHSPDEHLVETIEILAGNIVAGTGFTIYAANTSQLGSTRISGQWQVAWSWQ